MGREGGMIVGDSGADKSAWMLGGHSSSSSGRCNRTMRLKSLET